MTEADRARLATQLRFLLEADGLKAVERSCLLADGSRRETSAEHSWHLALMAIVLREHFAEPLDLARVLMLIAVHDLPEVYAGDTVVYDDAAIRTQVEREDTAARRLFGLLPEDQRSTMLALRAEFEAGETPEARFARALDAFQPTWQHWGDHANPPEEEIAAGTVLERKREAVGPVEALWDELTRIVEAARRRGLLAPG